MKFLSAEMLLCMLLAITPTANAQDAKVAERAATARVKGAADAPVTVYEIADFQCPFCSRFSREVFPRIDSAYVKSGKVKWIFVNLPLPNHANSWLAAEAAMCAGGVGNQFWAMHDRLFTSQADWAALADPAPTFAKYARQIGLSEEAFGACTGSDKTASILVRDLLNAASAGVTGTPAFVINNDPIFAGYRAFNEWRDLLDAALKKPAAPTK